MVKNIVIAVLVILFLLVGGYGLYATQQMQQYRMQAEQAVKSQQSTQMQLSDAQAKQAQAEEKAKQLELQATTMTVALAEENKSGESGTAILTENGGKVTVKVSLTGEPKGAIQPAHIHIGSCPGVGKVLYPLTDVVDGVSETVLNVTLDKLKQQLPLALNVHKSKTLITNYIACGPLGATDTLPTTGVNPTASSTATVTP